MKGRKRQQQQMLRPSMTSGTQLSVLPLLSVKTEQLAMTVESSGELEWHAYWRGKLVLLLFTFVWETHRRADRLAAAASGDRGVPVQLPGKGSLASTTNAAAKSSPSVMLGVQGPDRAWDQDRWAPVTNFHQHLSNCILEKSILHLKVVTCLPLCYLIWQCFSCTGERNYFMCSVRSCARWYLQCEAVCNVIKQTTCLIHWRPPTASRVFVVSQWDCCHIGGNKAGSPYRKMLVFSPKRGVQTGLLKSLFGR